MRKIIGFIVADIQQFGGMIKVISGALGCTKNLVVTSQELWALAIILIGQYQLLKDGGTSMERHGQAPELKTLDFLIVVPLKVGTLSGRSTTAF